MRSTKRILSGIILIAVYAFFFASTNLFYHSHVIADTKIVHSHPWSASSHSHSEGQLVLISVLNAEEYQQANVIDAPDAILSQVFIAEEAYCATILSSRSVHSFSLRAPPVNC